MPRRHAAVHRSDPPASALTDVGRYYSEKTARILAKYGPGPRVHFHSGHCTAPARATATADELRTYMHEAQEQLLERMALNVDGHAVLDVGCGLGGGALYWATRGARVTALTIVPEHVGVALAFARDADARSVTVLERDAHDLRGLGPFDTVVAIESSCYLDRPAWFRELRRVMGEDAHLHIVDCFARDRACVARFDSYWRTSVGSIESYDAAARAAGLRRVALDDLGASTAAFWDASIRWSELVAGGADAEERRRLSRSMDEHAWLRDSVTRGGIGYLFATYA